jgi:hypothetical protein
MFTRHYPHFIGYERDLKQEMYLALVKAIKRIHKGEIRSERNYIISILKFAAFKMAKKLIAYDKVHYYLEDLGLKKDGRKFESVMQWQDLFDMGCLPYEKIFNCFTDWEEKYMVLILLDMDGYTKRKFREKVGKSWPYVSELEHRVKEKLTEIIKMYLGNGRL